MEKRASGASGESTVTDLSTGGSGRRTAAKGSRDLQRGGSIQGKSGEKVVLVRRTD